ncbi:HAD-IA family hydrolase [Flavobacteriales bacterium]|nr:HAD-IA family hydrolase [Flavobacteriales bacterium]
MCNQINESVGFNVDTKEMYLMILYLLNENSIDYSKINIGQLFKEMENLVLSYPPLILNEKVIPILQTLKEKNKTISLLSNTGFIEGKTIEKILNNLHLKKYFNFEIYSDQLNLSKPNKKLFNIVYNNISELYCESIKAKEIMHIGDNPIADIQGAQNYGFSTFYVTDDNSFKELYLYAKEL